MPDALLADCLRRADADEAVRRVAHLGRHDRYQGSTGLERAAELVAEWAAEAGLSDVRIDHHPADGTARWWTWRAPVSWTPLRAVLEVHDAAGRVLRIDHAEQPCTVATYSAATGPEHRDVPLARLGERDVAGALVVAEGSRLTARLPRELEAAGALGFVTDAPWKGTPGAPHPGRVELPPGTALSAFSVTPHQLARIAAAADRGGRARPVVDVDRSAGMPVVSGVLPGTDPEADEVWLTAHLCHPRPGANDNASGVAATLAVAEVLGARPGSGAAPAARAPVRFFWGPEFLGQAAVLHQCLGPAPVRRLPRAVINLDMVGEDQSACASPFVVERPLDLVPSLLAPLAEHYVGEAFAATAAHPGTWQPSPFLGFSDHALYADPGVARPGVQFCHPADRFNHSAGDAVDKVSPMEMRRATAAAAALAHTLAADDRRDLGPLVGDWCARQRTRAAGVADGRDPGWARRYLARVEHGCAAVTALAAHRPPPAPPPVPESDEAPVAASWAGPLNLRAMMADLPHRTRESLTDRIARDKLCLAMLFHFAVRADGRRTRAGITDDTALALEREIPAAASGPLFDALLESGWLRETEKGRDSAPDESL